MARRPSRIKTILQWFAAAVAAQVLPVYQSKSDSIAPSLEDKDVIKQD